MAKNINKAQPVLSAAKKQTAAGPHLPSGRNSYFQMPAVMLGKGFKTLAKEAAHRHVDKPKQKRDPLTQKYLPPVVNKPKIG